jgi:type II secretory pathway component PulC
LKKREVARQERVRMQNERAIQAAQKQLASLKATEPEVARVTDPRPRQVIVIEDSDEYENEVVFEEDGEDDDLMFNEVVAIEDD